MGMMLQCDGCVSKSARLSLQKSCTLQAIHSQSGLAVICSTAVLPINMTRATARSTTLNSPEQACLGPVSSRESGASSTTLHSLMSNRGCSGRSGLQERQGNTHVAMGQRSCTNLQIPGDRAHLSYGGTGAALGTYRPSRFGQCSLWLVLDEETPRDGYQICSQSIWRAILRNLGERDSCFSSPLFQRDFLALSKLS